MENCILIFQLFQCTAKLVGTRGALGAAPDTVEPAYHLVGCEATYHLAEPLGITTAATMEIAVRDTSLLVQSHVNELAASAMGLVEHLALPLTLRGGII